MTQNPQNPQEIRGALSTREWDNPCIDKNVWGKGPWLNEPDKIEFYLQPQPQLQLDKEPLGPAYRCLAVRSEATGTWCGYVGVDKWHPAYGLHHDGLPALVAEIMQQEFRENLHKWYKEGHHGIPPLPENFAEPLEPSEVGHAVAAISVHGGLTYSDSPSQIGPEMWQHIRSQFDKAREIAKQYPIGDAARWLHRWASTEPAEGGYKAFLKMATSTCICFDPPDNDAWLFGFDTAHAFDLMPNLKQIMEKARFSFQGEEEKWKDVYRTLEYVQGECQSLVNQLRRIELKFGRKE